jgi:hypothetical protein
MWFKIRSSGISLTGRGHKISRNYKSTVRSVSGNQRNAENISKVAESLHCVIREVGQEPTSFDDVHFSDWVMKN